MPRIVGGGFVSPVMDKAFGGGDIEMGRKVVWDESAGPGGGGGDYEDRPSSADKEQGPAGDVSPDLSRNLPTESGAERRDVLYSRRSSWGRRSGSLNISPEILALAAAGVGDSRRVTEEDSENSPPTRGRENVH